jgi:TRAP-type C4-dicarboxylate transport system permease large subunit
VYNILIGFITPPVGIGLFVVSDIAEVPVAKVIKATLPFLVPLLVVLLIITYVPATVTWLPNLVYGS